MYKYVFFINASGFVYGNNRFWALQNKVVARRVWEEAKWLGVEGNGYDVVCVDQNEDGEIRDQRAMAQTVSNREAK